MSAQSQLPITAVAGSIKDQIRNLLGGGIPPRQVSLAVGCEESYISQLMQEEEFSQAVLAQNIIRLQSQSARDGKYDMLEDRLLEKLEQALPMMVNPDKILRAITVVNGAKRRGAAQDAPIAQITNVIHLNLPTMIVNRYQTNAQNEVVEVNGQGLVAMPANALLDRLKVIENASLPVLAQPAPGPATISTASNGITNTSTSPAPQLPASPPPVIPAIKDPPNGSKREETQRLLERIRNSLVRGQEVSCEQF